MIDLNMIILQLCVYLLNVKYCYYCIESASQIKVNEIVSYFDEGGDVVIVGDIDTDKSYRKLFYAFGIELD